MSAAFRTSSFTYHGNRLVYDDYGDGERLVVYLHGLLIDSEINRGIAQALATSGNRVVLLDLLGHGRSDKPEHASAYRIDSYADQVFALLDELGVDEAVLGGMSLGANVSLFAASRQPGRVRGLVLEMPVLDRAVPPAALFFASLLLLVHYARTPARWFSSLVRLLPETPSEAINGLLHGAAQPPEVMTATVAKIDFGGSDAPGVKVEGFGEVVLQMISAGEGAPPARISGAPVLAAFSMESENLAFANGTKFSDPDLRPWESLGAGGVVSDVVVWTG